MLERGTARTVDVHIETIRSARREHVGEDLIARLNIAIQWIRERRGVRRADAFRVHFIRCADRDQLAGANDGQLANDHGVDHRVDGGVGARAEGESSDDQRGERLVASQRSNGERDVASKIGEDGRATLGVFALMVEREHAVAGAGDVAELPVRFAASRVVVPSFRDQAFDARLDMERELVVHFAFDAGAAEWNSKDFSHGDVDPSVLEGRVCRRAQAVKLGGAGGILFVFRRRFRSVVSPGWRVESVRR